MEDFWSDKFALRDMLLSTNLTMAEIAKELGVTQANLSKEIKALGLAWIKRKHRKMSRGESSLTEIMRKIFPNEEITNEFHVGDRLRLDVYCPRHKIGVEYHGRQHFDHITHFHATYDDFRRAQQRDINKIEKCKELGITLIIFKYNDELSEDIVYDRILDALQKDASVGMPPKVEKRNKRSMKGTPMYEEMRAKKREFDRELRNKIKHSRRNEPRERQYD